VRAIFATLAFTALACCVAAVPHAAAMPQPSVNEIASPPAQLIPARAIPVQDDYRIGAQDTLEIAVFQVEDLSRSVRVDSGGKIRLPLIGEVMAGGRTTKELSDDLAAELGKKYMNYPRVTVTLKESVSQRVTVDGAVVQPGIYPLSGETSLLQALALAQGPGELADLRRIAVFRTTGTQRTAAVFDVAAIRAGRAADPRILANDVIIVETSGGQKFLRRMRNALPLFQMLLFF